MPISPPQTVAGRSQAGHKPPARVFPENLTELRKALGLSYSGFGKLLWEAHAGGRRKPYSKPYIIALENGSRVITPGIALAFLRLAAAQDEVDPLTLTATEQTVYAEHDIAGAVVLGEAKLCARPGCRVRFVGVRQQKYHSIACRKAWYRQVRQET